MAKKPFPWNAEEALKLLDRGYQVVLFKDGLGSFTALAIPETKSLDAGVTEWQDCDGEDADGTYDADADLVFGGPNKFSGCGFSVGEALHCLTEKVVFNRLPDTLDGDK